MIDSEGFRHLSEPSSLQLKENWPSIKKDKLWLVAGRAVVGVVTRGPGEIEGERGVEVVETPSEDHVIEEIRVEGDHYHAVADA